MIRITAKRDGFRRCGVNHSEKPICYPANRFTALELAELKNEPWLIVEDLSEQRVMSDGAIQESINTETMRLEAEYSKRLEAEKLRLAEEYQVALEAEKAKLVTPAAKSAAQKK